MISCFERSSDERPSRLPLISSSTHAQVAFSFELGGPGVPRQFGTRNQSSVTPFHDSAELLAACRVRDRLKERIPA